MIIFYDLETTGLNQYHDKITEMCFIKQTPLDFNDQTFTSLINPEKPIPDIVKRITGITDDMVKDKPTFENISEQLVYFINNNLKENEKVHFIAHNNIGFDKLVLSAHFKRIGIDIKQFNWVFLDTLLIAKKVYPHFKKYNLKSLCQELGVQTLGAHRAEADTTMLKNLFYRIMQDMTIELKKSLGDIISDLDLIDNYTY
jgi:DNA polymerase III subunit alpha, Gram-positive type